MKNNQINLIVLININNKELIRLLLIVRPSIFIKHILCLIITFGKPLKLDIIFNVVCLVQLDAGINLFRKLLHLLGLQVVAIFDNRVCMRFGLVIV